MTGLNPVAADLFQVSTILPQGQAMRKAGENVVRYLGNVGNRYRSANIPVASPEETLEYVRRNYYSIPRIEKEKSAYVTRLRKDGSPLNVTDVSSSGTPLGDRKIDYPGGLII